MLPDEVREAMERIEFRLRGVWEPQADVHADFAVIKAHLLAREAEVERHVKMLADCFRMAGADTDGNEDWRIAPDALRAVTDLRRDYDDVLDWQARCERAEALLREALGQVLSNIGFMAVHNVTDGSIESAKEIHDRITAHLSENSRD